MRIVPSASELVAEDAVVAVSVVVAVVPLVRSVLLSLLWAAVVQSDLVVLVVVHMLFASPAPLHQVSRAFLSRPGDAIRRCPFAHPIAVALCKTHRFLFSRPMRLAGSIEWLCDLWTPLLDLR